MPFEECDSAFRVWAGLWPEAVARRAMRRHLAACHVMLRGAVLSACPRLFIHYDADELPGGAHHAGLHPGSGGGQAGVGWVLVLN